MIAVALSDIGLLRKKNEDNYLTDELNQVFAVCDGMGGHKGGEIASALAIKTLKDYIRVDNLEEAVSSLKESIIKANFEIWNKGNIDPECYQMGTTLTCIIIIDDSLIVGHVGDSCLYLFRDKKIQKLTKDHTLAEKMLTEGLIKKENMHENSYNHILTRALGVEATVEVDLFIEKSKKGDKYLLCSDGLNNLLNDQEIAYYLDEGNDIKLIAHKLMNEALLKGGYDNITIVLIEN